jgi:hypothetical protein
MLERTQFTAPEGVQLIRVLVVSIGLRRRIKGQANLGVFVHVSQQLLAFWMPMLWSLTRSPTGPNMTVVVTMLVTPLFPSPPLLARR